MSAGLIAMLTGIFVVPGVLVWAGQGLRRRSARWHSAFWGAVIAHALIIPIGLLAAFLPPESWSAGDFWRGLFGFWGFLLGPVLGAVVGAGLSRDGSR